MLPIAKFDSIYFALHPTKDVLYPSPIAYINTHPLIFALVFQTLQSCILYMSFAPSSTGYLTLVITSLARALILELYNIYPRNPSKPSKLVCAFQVIPHIPSYPIHLQM